MSRYYTIICLLFLQINGYAAVFTHKKTMPDTPVCIQVMKTFSPDGDGKDDVWKIGNLDCMIAAEVKIYSRWGELVYESEQYKNDWNGVKKKKPLPAGTYIYLLKILLANNTLTELKGDVTILR